MRYLYNITVGTYSVLRFYSTYKQILKIWFLNFHAQNYFLTTIFPYGLGTDSASLVRIPHQCCQPMSWDIYGHEYQNLWSWVVLLVLGTGYFAGTAAQRRSRSKELSLPSWSLWRQFEVTCEYNKRRSMWCN